MINNPFQSTESRRRRVLTVYEFKRKSHTSAEIKQAARRRTVIRALSISAAVVICFTTLWLSKRVFANTSQSTASAHAAKVLRGAMVGDVAMHRLTRRA